MSQVVPQIFTQTTGFPALTAATEVVMGSTPAIIVPRDSCVAIVLAMCDLTFGGGGTVDTIHLRRGTTITGQLLDFAFAQNPFLVAVNNRYSMIGVDTLAGQGTVQYSLTVTSGTQANTPNSLTIAVLLFF
jgi:hypothetical protein